MYMEKLSAEEWKSAAVQFIEIINRQYCIISKHPVISGWSDCGGVPRVTLKFASRNLRLAFEAIWCEAMQGNCAITGACTLVLDYL